MEHTLAERAITALRAYLSTLAGGCPRRGVRRAQRRPRRMGRKAVIAREELVQWEARKVAEWAAGGRILEDGTLRVPVPNPPVYTLKTVARMWPELDARETLDVLIQLDGFVGPNFMARQKKIRQAIEEIVEQRMLLLLSDRAVLERVAHAAHRLGLLERRPPPTRLDVRPLGPRDHGVRPDAAPTPETVEEAVLEGSTR